MSLTIRYEATQTVLTSIGSNAIRLGALTLQQSAQLGEPALSENKWDDDAGAWVLQGYREFWVNETSAPVNDQVIYNGFVASRTYTRGTSQRTTLARQLNVETADGNVALGWRILYDGAGANSAKRPAETAGDRIRWLVNSSGVLPSLYAHPTIFANPSTAMDANDYRGQRYNDVLGDIANVTGYNFFVTYSETRSRSELLFMDPNGSAYPSTISISNVLADVNGNHNTVGTVFAPSEDADLHIDPSRIAADAYVAYDGGAVFVSRASTAATFVRVDQAAPTANVKSAAKATALANRYLDDNDEEDERIGCSIVVPASQVNDLRQGMLTSARFSHFPGWETARPCRVLRRTVIQDEAIGQNAYRIDLELSPTGSSPASCSVALSGAQAYHTSNNAYSSHTVSLAVSPSTSSFVIAGAVAYNGNTPQDSAMVATGSWTTEHSQQTPAGAPAMGVFSRAGVSGSTNVTGSYTGGFSAATDSWWAVVATAIPTAATSLVQDAGLSDNGVGDTDVTFSSPPTPGNLMVMIVAVRGVTAPPDATALIVPGWTKQTDAFTLFGGLHTCNVSIWTKCAGVGEASTHGFSGLSHESVNWIGELAIT